MARTGRPRKEIDKKQFETLVRMGCNRSTIVAFFDSTIEGGCCDDTIDRWCKRTYKEDKRELSFAEVLDKRKELQKIPVFQAIEQGLKNCVPSIVIFAAKNRLGWSDNPQEAVVADTTKDDGLSQSLRELAEGLESDD